MAPPGRPGVGLLVCRAAGWGCIVFTLVPLWLVLAGTANPIALEAVRRTGAEYVTTLVGAVALALVAILGSRFGPAVVLAHGVERAGRRLAAGSDFRHALGLALLSTLLGVGMSWVVFDRQPVLVDAQAQLAHARYLAEGLLGGPSGHSYEFWIGTNTFVAAGRWVSQYPPGHGVALAAGLWVGSPWLVGPIAAGLTVFWMGLLVGRLFPDEIAAARLGVLLLAVSPMFIVLGAAQLSHVTAAALASAAAYSAARSRDGALGWSAVSGLALGALFATRPLTSAVLAPVLTLGIWLSAGTNAGVRRLAARGALALLCALAVAAPAMWYSWKLFRHPLAFGYLAYLGPAHAPGFHTDPYGYPYTPLLAAAYTSSDLTSLGFNLFRVPLPLVAVIGAYLVTARSFDRATVLVTLWATALVAALAGYWHHDLALGPRLLGDVLPAWSLLAAVAVTRLVRSLPTAAPRSGLSLTRPGAVAALVLAAGVAAAVMIPSSAVALRARFGHRLQPPPHRESLVFVHDSWADRTAATLVAAGMRGDSVARLLAGRDLCDVHALAWARWQERAAASTPSPTACERERRADRLGALPLLPLLWQTDLPGIEHGAALVARDLGPERNLLLRSRYPERTAFVLFRRAPGGPAVLAPYDVGMEILWGR